MLQILYCGAGSPTSEYQLTSVEIHRNQIEDVIEWVKAGVADGSIRATVNPHSVAAQYIAYISGMAYLRLISPELIDIRTANEDMKQTLRLSLQTN